MHGRCTEKHRANTREKERDRERTRQKERTRERKRKKDRQRERPTLEAPPQDKKKRGQRNIETQAAAKEDDVRGTFRSSMQRQSSIRILDSASDGNALINSKFSIQSASRCRPHSVRADGGVSSTCVPAIQAETNRV